MAPNVTIGETVVLHYIAMQLIHYNAAARQIQLINHSFKKKSDNLVSSSCLSCSKTVPSTSHLPSESVSCDFKGSLLSDAGHYFGGTVTFGFNKKVIN